MSSTLFALLIPCFPLLGFVVNGGGTGAKIHGPGPPSPGGSKNLAGFIGCATVGISFLMSAMIFVQSLQGNFNSEQINFFQWITAGNVDVSFSFYIDHLTLIMLMIITGVGFLIHVYSVAYMRDDEGFRKFFSFMNLFIFFMLILVLAANYVVMFIGWEGVGLCSYLLIGFWWKNRDFSAAANKAFIMNRIGDLGFILGIFLMFLTFGSSDFSKVFSGASSFTQNDTVIVAITLLLFIGAVGKSAQIPLFTWLPDAMAGPTPVSALIHAATMVTAGVYMVARSNILYTLAPISLEVVAYTGAFTALLAGAIAITQNDIKKVLAYSTVSQLGYMFVALGCSAFDSAIFHLMTHAFFKALLFLGAGSVIHAMSGEQNIRKMGALRKALPITFITFLIATCAISGIPPFAGFFSKDEILVDAYGNSFFLFSIISITSVFTAAYMFRLLFMVFWGEFRGSDDEKNHLHESPALITVPLIILAILSAVGGFLGMPAILGDHSWIRNYLDPVFAGNPQITTHFESASVEWNIILVSLAAFIVIIYFANLFYNRRKVEMAIDLSQKNFFYRLSYNKFYVDELYNKVIVVPLEAMGDFFGSVIEHNLIDGIINGLGALSLYLASQFRKLQTGNIGFYVFAMVIAIIVILIFGLGKLNAF